MISRDLDLLKGRGITSRDDHACPAGRDEETSEIDISSLVDTWLLLRNDESNGERNRLLFVIKSRGSAHSNQVREFLLTDDGAELRRRLRRPARRAHRLRPRRADRPGALAEAARPTRASAGARSWPSDQPRSGPRSPRCRPSSPPTPPSSSGSRRPPTQAVHPVSPYARLLGRERSGDREARDLVTTESEEFRPRSTPRATRRRRAMFDLRLYVAGQSPRSVRALREPPKVCDEHLAGRYRVEVIDLLVNPALARGDEIVAVPTLVRKLPEPIRKIIGDLSDTDRVLVGLQLRPWAATCRDRGGRGPALGADALRERRLAPLLRGDRDRSDGSATRTSPDGSTSTWSTPSTTPARSMRDRILALPTLVKHSPEPRRHLVGDLTDLDRVRVAPRPRSAQPNALRTPPRPEELDPNDAPTTTPSARTGERARPGCASRSPTSRRRSPRSAAAASTPSSSASRSRSRSTPSPAPTAPTG